MYKIYINEIPVVLKKSSDIVLEDTKGVGALVARYTGKSKHLLNYIDMCEKNGNAKSVIIHHHDFDQLKSDFLGLFNIVEACGGLIKNENNEFLFIFRRGFWDLPKGKMEKGETRRETAIREVIEETGIKKVNIENKIGITNHAFKNKSGKRLIKKSHWYLMTSSDQKLKPQLEEDIEIAEWVKMTKFKSNYKPVYGNINDVLQIYMESLSKKMT